MSVPITPKEEVTLLLNQWYEGIRAGDIEKSAKLKEELETHMQQIEEENVKQYYWLLHYRYLEMKNDVAAEFDLHSVNLIKVKILDIPKDTLLQYYYYFFQASHETGKGQYKKAQVSYEKAENLLNEIPDPLEKAEFYFKYSQFLYYINNLLAAWEYASKAKDIFSKHSDYGFKVAGCHNVIGIVCLQLEQFENAEMQFNIAMNILQKRNVKEEENYIIRTKYNLGVMYADQNLSELAIRYLSETREKLPNHFRAIFLEAREYFKLGKTKIAKDLIADGLNLCEQLKQEEYRQHFTILKAMNQKVSAEKLEEIITDSFSYFEEEGLWEYVLEYTEKLAVQFYEEGDKIKGSEYFYIAHKEREEAHKKGALK